MQAVIIGGGIIGLFSAWYLRKAGWEVTLVDKGDLLNGCSYGNAGMITPSHFVPLAAPGVLSQAFKWLFSTSSPFHIRPRLNRNMISWSRHFIRNASESHAERSAAPLRDLLLMGRSLYEELEPELSFSLQKKGIIMYYRSEEAAREEIKLAVKAKELGLETQVYDLSQLRMMEPAMDVQALGGVHYKCDAHLHPAELMKQLLQQLKDEVRWIRNTAGTFEKKNGSIAGVRAGGQLITGDLFILSGGSWSAALAASLGIRMPLVAGKGYSVTLEMPGAQLRHPAILCEARVALTPMNRSLRFGGTMEIGSAAGGINMKRVKGITDAVNTYFPALHAEVPARENIWAGLRPVSADGLPYIGKTRRYGNLIIATGHSMLGLGAAPATGRLVAEIAEGKAPSLGLEAFRPDRFDT
ncbi:D-amino-acid dehydrogenase [Anseongella ginsenosidimutans]|uniref:D-amino-acid dehydrogenase n=1 Tax=Anseongella ginsenosidimutans TaxID=496056 RepID=A0A4R3KX98_9SPHI|nr:FAD-dependent oxidoreductase [Anseongella ginsenosidimutans]QEC51257.1 FAD-dependent oxidoreductase [Anseongella ginsenosidimutans]TCS90058.1 D-amino-acid dehydrogenase [Anseongella ginsenosidimutans]